MRLIHVTVTLQRVEGADASYEADFLVDTGATDSLAPARELRRIGVAPAGRMAYELANGSVHEYAFGLARIDTRQSRLAAQRSGDRTNRT